MAGFSPAIRFTHTRKLCFVPAFVVFKNNSQAHVSKVIYPTFVNVGYKDSLNRLKELFVIEVSSCSMVFP
ncbi:hypothetical protein ASG14_13585 [Pedobacter sp. Leaf194]|nr:hypothetical protein ASG14_13585 [Pedobacter sp. Leaf194]